MLSGLLTRFRNHWFRQYSPTEGIYVVKEHNHIVIWEISLWPTCGIWTGQTRQRSHSGDKGAVLEADEEVGPVEAVGLSAEGPAWQHVEMQL